MAGRQGALFYFSVVLALAALATPAAAVTEFPVPTAVSQPAGITVGPDGALWFTEENGHKIGRITTAGAITEFPTLTNPSGPSEITAGPDGALWFTEFAANPPQIGRITTAGVRHGIPARRRQRPGRNHRRTGRRPVVHRERNPHDRADHHRREHHGVPAPQRVPAR